MFSPWKVKTEEDKEGKSLRPVAARLSELLGKEVKFVPTTRGPELEKAIDELKDGEVLLFEIHVLKILMVKRKQK
ncbi:phosphoglycerate kinase [Listeria monocytogenes]|uniref:phosphoglycerate kinase n=1 Tax=Listeria monocytogenes TaxID=1639 RepID=UPI0039EE5CC9